MANRSSVAHVVDRRTNRLILLLLVLNIVMVLIGVFGMAWEAKRDAARRIVPTNLAQSQSPAPHN